MLGPMRTAGQPGDLHRPCVHSLGHFLFTCAQVGAFPQALIFPPIQMQCLQSMLKQWEKCWVLSVCKARMHETSYWHTLGGAQPSRGCAPLSEEKRGPKDTLS